MTNEQKIFNRDLSEADWIGEGETIAVSGKFTRIGAYRKMRKLFVSEVGVIEWQDMECNKDSLYIRYFHLVKTDEEKDHFDAWDGEVEWYVSDKKSKYKVWCIDVV